ncbi:MAG: four helix bundle protein [Planctomycetota bacterium]
MPEDQRSGRLQPELLDRCVEFSIAAVQLSQRFENDQRPAPIVNQVLRSSTSIGAQLHEADEAMSDRDFLKCCGIAVKEVRETEYWLRLIRRLQWASDQPLTAHREEAKELRLILKSIIARTRKRLNNG